MPAHKGCPGDLDATSKRRWQVAKAEIEKRGWRDSDHPTLERYIRLLRMMDRAIQHIEAEGEVLDAGGSKGQPVANPWVKLYMDAAKAAETAADKLMLTPAARARLGEDPKPPGTGKFAGAFG